MKAVIFDCFGVLTREGWFNFRDVYFGNDPGKRDQAGAALRQMNLGLINHDDFLEELARLAGVEKQDVRDIDESVPDEKLFGYIEKELKPYYKIGMLSNAGGDWTEKLFGAKRAALFDEVVLSYQMGTVKPDPLMYQTIADRLGVLPEECVFVDDQERHCDGARRVGMKTVFHADTDKTIARIEELLHA